MSGQASFLVRAQKSRIALSAKLPRRRENPCLLRDVLKRSLYTDPLPFEKLTARKQKAVMFMATAVYSFQPSSRCPSILAIAVFLFGEDHDAVPISLKAFLVFCPR